MEIRKVISETPELGDLTCGERSLNKEVLRKTRGKNAFQVLILLTFLVLLSECNNM